MLTSLLGVAMVAAGGMLCYHAGIHAERRFYGQADGLSCVMLCCGILLAGVGGMVALG